MPSFFAYPPHPISKALSISLSSPNPVSRSVIQSFSQLFPPVRETPFLQRGTFTLFLIANAFHFCILALSMSSILLFDDALGSMAFSANQIRGTT